MAMLPEDGAGASLVRWRKIGTDQASEFSIFRVLKQTWNHPGRQKSGDFYVIETSDWVIAVALTTGGELVMIRQFRFGTGDFSLEAPGGVMDRGEDPIDAARRELLEETGYGGGTARLLASVSPNPAIQTNRHHVVFLDGVHPSGVTEFDEHEEVETVLMPVEQVLDLAHGGGIIHALVMNALFLFEREWRRRPATG